MNNNSDKVARRRETARLCTGSYLGNLPNHRGSANVVNAAPGQVLPTRAQVAAARQATETPQPGIVIGARVRASSTDPSPPLQQVQAKKKRVFKPLTAEKREAYNAKRRLTAEQRKYSGISYTKPNEKNEK